MSLEKWVEYGWLKKEPTSPGEIKDLLGIVERSLTDAKWLTKSLYWAVGLHAGWDWSQSYLYGVPDSGQVASGHLFATHPSGPTGPEGSI